MIDAAIDERNFFHAGLNRSNGTVHFGNHAFVDDAGFFERVHFADLQTKNFRQVKISVPEKPSALPPIALIVLTISGLISRDKTFSTTSTLASSVTRWP